MNEHSQNPLGSPPASDAGGSIVPDPQQPSESLGDTVRLPTLYRDRAFWGLNATQFLGAFNDNLFKQILLLMFVAVPTAAGPRDLQGLATFVFSIPFILFSGYAGYLSDRHSKRRMIVSCKVAEIAIMAGGVGAFFLFSRIGMAPAVVGMLFAVLFFMGAQSAFFGPSKYGVLPEMLRPGDLPAANGWILMTTFLAIILGAGLAGFLLELFESQLWQAGLICVGIAAVGTITSLTLRRAPPSQPELAITPGALAITKEMQRLIFGDAVLRNALIASTVFWSAAAMVQMGVNAFGMRQLELSETQTSIMAGMISFGIAAGCIVAGQFSKHRFNARVLQVGLCGMVVTLTLLASPGAARGGHLLGHYGSIPVLIALGGFTGMFAVPLQVFMQSRPPEGFKGRMIATQNLLNWVGITLSAVLYAGVTRVLDAMQLPVSGVFAFTGLMMVAVAIWYRPVSIPLADTGDAGR